MSRYPSKFDKVGLRSRKATELTTAGEMIEVISERYGAAGRMTELRFRL